MTDQLDRFESALLADLRTHVATRSASEPPRGSRVRLLTAAALVVVGGIAAALVVPGLGSQAAYSVTEGNSGEVRVRVDRPEDATGLETALAEYGIVADIVYVPDGGVCEPGRFTPVTRSLSGLSLSVGRERLEIVVPPGAVRDGETFVLSVSVVPLPNGSISSVDVDVATGPVSPCVPTPPIG